ncbi:MAG: c-type cytochrome [Gammaproteobacteria bacterium]|nr:c-type cytochrome [Gammaproteobacteria bacterium]
MKRMDKKALTLGYWRLVLAGLIVVLLMPTAGRSQGESIAETVEALQAKVDSLTRKVQLERGRTVYSRACSPCHGIRGDGEGPAAKGFDPPPRNFRRGVYKFRTTVSGALPLDKDLERTIREGVPGTEMPRWKDVLSEHDIKAVAQYVKTFSPFFEDPDSLPLPEDILEIPESRPFEPSSASIAAGRRLFIDQDCVKCHGENGEGDGVEADELVDDWDVPIRPANLTLRHFKNGKQDRDIFRVFTTALNGTPMPAFDELTEEQRWQLVDYIKSLEQKGWFYSLFKENPNQVRHPDPEEKTDESGA